MAYELTAQLEGFTIRGRASDAVRPLQTQDFELGIAPLADTIVVTPSGTERTRASTTESFTVFTSRRDRPARQPLGRRRRGPDPGARHRRRRTRRGDRRRLFSRGGEADYNHVLIDGVRVNHQRWSQFDFSRVSAAEIDRVEVVRGARNRHRFGSDAIGSVVQIFTKRGTRNRSAAAERVGGRRFVQDLPRRRARILGGALDKIDYHVWCHAAQHRTARLATSCPRRT